MIRDVLDFLLGTVIGVAIFLPILLVWKRDEFKRRLLRKTQEDSLRNQERALFGDRK